MVRKLKKQSPSDQLGDILYEVAAVAGWLEELRDRAAKLYLEFEGLGKDEGELLDDLHLDLARAGSFLHKAEAVIQKREEKVEQALAQADRPD